MIATILRTLGTFVLSAAFLTAPLHAEPAAPQAASIDANANAGATPIDDGGKTLQEFHGKPGIQRIATELADLNFKDPRIAKSFEGVDKAHFAHMVAVQFCYILGGSCTYTGKSMRKAHAEKPVSETDMGAVVENLQAAMDKEGVPFRAQNRLLAKLAPMKRDIVTR